MTLVKVSSNGVDVMIFGIFFSITSSIISTLKRAPLSLWCFKASCTSNVISLSSTHKIHFPFVTLTTILATFMNGLPRIKGTLTPSFISMMTKSTGMVNLPTHIGMFSTIPRGNLMERSASCIIMCVSFIATFPILFSKDNVT